MRKKSVTERVSAQIFSDFAKFLPRIIELLAIILGPLVCTYGLLSP